MIDFLDDKRHKLTSYYLEHGNLSILEVDEKGNILDFNDNFKEKVENKSNILDIITQTHKQTFKKNLKLIKEKKQFSFKTNFSFDPTNVEDLPQTANLFIEYIDTSSTILIYIEMLPPLKHKEVVEYFSLMTQFSLTNRKLEKTKVELEKLTLTLNEKVEEEVRKNLKKEQLLFEQSKMAIMGEMIGNIAHQWKQPLNLISMANSTLKLNQELEGFVTEKELTSSIKDIENSVHHLSNTIDDFRNFFRPEKQKTNFYINDVFTKTFKLISSEFKNSDIELITNIDNIELINYQNELLQVLLNIFKNAKDELIKKSLNERKLIFVETQKLDDSLAIKIKDNAGGIPEDIIGKIFNPYFTTKKDDEGTGIGLYMSKQIVENMDGSINVNNSIYTYEQTKFTGAEFKIYLPL